MKTRYLRLVKRQRGFTLIELLAVILILGIIALIAIPTVNSVVEQSRRGAAESSATQFVTSIGELVMTRELSGEKLLDGVYTSDELINKGLNIKGTMPDSGYVQIENSDVVGCFLNYGNYNVSCENEDYKSVKKEDLPKFTLVDDNDSNNALSNGDKVCIDSECFYVIGISGDSVRMLTEWNLNVGYARTFNGSHEVDYNLFVGDNNYIDEYKLISIDTLDLEKLTPNSKSLITQDKKFFGYYYDWDNDIEKIYGAINFAELKKEDYNPEYNRWPISGYYDGYWVDSSGKLLSKYGSYNNSVFDSNSLLYEYVVSYANNLKIKYGIDNITGDLPLVSEIQKNGCPGNECLESKKWIYQTTYWTSNAYNKVARLSIVELNGWVNNGSIYQLSAGLRPVIVINKTLIKG